MAKCATGQYVLNNSNSKVSTSSSISDYTSNKLYNKSSVLKNFGKAGWGTPVDNNVPIPFYKGTNSLGIYSSSSLLYRGTVGGRGGFIYYKNSSHFQNSFYLHSFAESNTKDKILKLNYNQFAVYIPVSTGSNSYSETRVANAGGADVTNVNPSYGITLTFQLNIETYNTVYNVLTNNSTVWSQTISNANLSVYTINGVTFRAYKFIVTLPSTEYLIKNIDTLENGYLYVQVTNNTGREYCGFVSMVNEEEMPTASLYTDLLSAVNANNKIVTETDIDKDLNTYYLNAVNLGGTATPYGSGYYTAGAPINAYIIPSNGSVIAGRWKDSDGNYYNESPISLTMPNYNLTLSGYTKAWSSISSDSIQASYVGFYNPDTGKFHYITSKETTWPRVCTPWFKYSTNNRIYKFYWYEDYGPDVIGFFMTSGTTYKPTSETFIENVDNDNLLYRVMGETPTLVIKAKTNYYYSVYRYGVDETIGWGNSFYYATGITAVNPTTNYIVGNSFVYPTMQMSFNDGRSMTSIQRAAYTFPSFVSSPLTGGTQTVNISIGELNTSYDISVKARISIVTNDPNMSLNTSGGDYLPGTQLTISVNSVTRGYQPSAINIDSENVYYSYMPCPYTVPNKNTTLTCYTISIPTDYIDWRGFYDVTNSRYNYVNYSTRVSFSTKNICTPWFKMSTTNRIYKYSWTRSRAGIGYYLYINTSKPTLAPSSNYDSRLSSPEGNFLLYSNEGTYTIANPYIIFCNKTAGAYYSIGDYSAFQENITTTWLSGFTYATGITAVNPTTSYYVGDTFVKPTMKMTFNDSSTNSSISKNYYAFSGYNMGSVGSQTVTVTIGNLSTSYTISVLASTLTVTLKSNMSQGTATASGGGKSGSTTGTTTITGLTSGTLMEFNCVPNTRGYQTKGTVDGVPYESTITSSVTHTMEVMAIPTAQISQYGFYDWSEEKTYYRSSRTTSFSDAITPWFKLENNKIYKYQWNSTSSSYQYYIINKSGIPENQTIYDVCENTTDSTNGILYFNDSEVTAIIKGNSSWLYAFEDYSNSTITWDSGFTTGTSLTLKPSFSATYQYKNATFTKPTTKVNFSNGTINTINNSFATYSGNVMTSVGTKNVTVSLGNLSNSFYMYVVNGYNTNNTGWYNQDEDIIFNYAWGRPLPDYLVDYNSAWIQAPAFFWEGADEGLCRIDIGFNNIDTTIIEDILNQVYLASYNDPDSGGTYEDYYDINYLSNEGYVTCETIIGTNTLTLRLGFLISDIMSIMDYGNALGIIFDIDDETYSYGITSMRYGLDD